MIWDILATLLDNPQAETTEIVKQQVTYAAVDPNVMIGGFISSAAAVIVSIMGVWASLINRKKISEVHVLVNSQFSAYKEAVARILELEKAKSISEEQSSKKE